MHELTQLSVERVEAIAADKQQNARNWIMANWLVEAGTQDKSRQSLFDRLFGKVTDKVDLNVSADARKLSDEDLFRILTDNQHLLVGGD
jgi:hypothetical protein